MGSRVVELTFKSNQTSVMTETVPDAPPTSEQPPGDVQPAEEQPTASAAAATAATPGSAATTATPQATASSSAVKEPSKRPGFYNVSVFKIHFIFVITILKNHIFLDKCQEDARIRFSNVGQ